MIIRTCQYFSLIVIFIPLLHILSYLSLASIPIFAWLTIGTLTVLLTSFGLGIKLQIQGIARLTTLTSAIPIAVFLYLLFKVSGHSTSYLLALYISGIHAFAIHWLLTYGHPLKAQSWRNLSNMARSGLCVLVIFKLLSWPVFMIWVWYYLLFPEETQRGQFGDILFYIGIPMTFIAPVFAMAYLPLQYFLGKAKKH
jgi:hypothetical protein